MSNKSSKLSDLGYAIGFILLLVFIFISTTVSIWMKFEQFKFYMGWQPWQQ